MQGDVRKLNDEYQSKMEQIFKAHEDQMKLAQEMFQQAVDNAHAQMQQVYEQSQSEAQPREQPLAVWTTDQQGKDILVLNREAGIMQMALLDKLHEVLQELLKMAPQHGRK